MKLYNCFARAITMSLEYSLFEYNPAFTDIGQGSFSVPVLEP